MSLALFRIFIFGMDCRDMFLRLKYRKFMNRGMLNSPLCIVYGNAAVIITIGFPELFDEIPILFLAVRELVHFLSGLQQDS